MTTLEIVLLIGLFLVIAISAPGHAASYRNGVVDGYGFSKEPNCPGYAAAGEYLCKTMAHRWSELKVGKCNFAIESKLGLHRCKKDADHDGSHELDFLNLT